MKEYKVFVGVDERQPLGYNVLQHSIHKYASKPVCVQPLQLRQLPMERRGLTQFTFSRFLVPYLCDFVGSAIFMDADIVVKGDIIELFECANVVDFDVQVNKAQKEFEWPSVMLFNCMRCRTLTPEYVDNVKNALFDFAWAKSIGDFPAEWNHCVGYEEPRLDAKLYHYTQGLPCWNETKGQLEDQMWDEEFKDMVRTCSWKELMGKSVHARPVLERMFKRYQ